MFSKEARIFIDALKQASSQIGEVYFHPKVAVPGKSPYRLRLWRERVYCYELYHQLRVSLAAKEITSGMAPYFIFGEMDKAGHPALKGTRFAPKPDFIFHHPGKSGSSNNVAVVEVKTILASDNRRVLCKSLETLCKTQKMLDYQLALIYVFGYENDDPEVFRWLIKTITAMKNNRLHIVWHKEVKTPAKFLCGWHDHGDT
ncbi:MAG: hypothetical protein OWU33_10790 [Firmicutes bacterium]|nr:hypothetical protein [Bacillota bacterium]